ncbi:hypothetical protein PF586_05890 [Lactobacillus delbrueckii]|uniref:Uncharacterized protein n=1 Tax=Lactobacillus delbrueckii TaxID=1584 RepID=A0AAW5YVD2_9LACO|nr:hypothetical protein [Lactobacillus delbrueckii]MDA3767992.1 hypothetical protein [Lactobacillus delbrueckii]
MIRWLIHGFFWLLGNHPIELWLYGGFIFGLTSLIMAQAFEANAKSEFYDEKTLEVLGIAIAAQCATLNGFIEAGELDQNFVYESYINLVQGWK